MSSELKILLIPSAAELVPATRYRVTQYLPYLEKEGIEYRVFPIVSSWLTRWMIKSPEFYGIKRLVYYMLHVLEKLMRTMMILVIASNYDCIFLQRTTFEFGLERLLAKVNKNIIFDLDDAIFIPDTKEKGLIYKIKESLKNKEVNAVLKISRHVIVENDYIENYVSKFCPNTSKIVGPIDTKRYFSSNTGTQQKRIVIGWIGSPSTTRYLQMLDGVFKSIAAKHKDIEFKFIGATSYLAEGLSPVFKKWDYATEVEELRGCDIGVMPMPDDQWSRGKVGIKMLQYMSLGIPAVVSYTPTNTEIIEDGSNGFIARCEDDWIRILSTLIDNPELRSRIGQNAEATVARNYSLESSFEKWLTVIKEVAYE